MSTSDKKVMVGLYLKGCDLDPQKITQLLGVPPSVSHSRGEVHRTSSGREFITKLGLWGLVIDKDPAEVSDVVENLIAVLGPHTNPLATLPQVQEAYFDIFVGADSDEDGEGKCEMELTDSQLSSLSNYGLPVRFTVSIGRP